jgi:hypothetical protein
MLIAAASGPSIFIWGAIVAAGLGIFLWPMMLILFALHSLNSLARLDLVFLTIARTFAAYLAIWLLLLLVAVLMYLPAALWLLSLLNVQTITQPVFLQGRDIVIKIGLALFQTYLMLVAMRIIGLYYLHFKRRFAIVME